MGEIRRPIKRINDPAVFGSGDILKSFFSQKVMIGEKTDQAAVNQSLRSGIGFSDKVDISLKRDRPLSMKIPLKDVPRFTSDIPSGLEIS